MQNHLQNAQASETQKRARNHQSHFQNYFKEVIYGGIDGIITTFAVVAGFSGAALASETTTQLSFLVVLLFGLANLFADGVAMGLGNFLSVRSDQDLYNTARTAEELKIKKNFQLEFDETISILKEKGYSSEDATTLATIYAKNITYWLDFMMTHELEMPDPRGDNPALTGLATFTSFLVFGSIPILPFMFFDAAHTNSIFLHSVFGTAFALVLLGLLKWKIVGSSLGKSLFEVLAVGGCAAVIAFFVGSFFSL